MTPTLTPTKIQEHIGNVKIVLEQVAVICQYIQGIKVYTGLIWNISCADCRSAILTTQRIDLVDFLINLSPAISPTLHWLLSDYSGITRKS